MDTLINFIEKQTALYNTWKTKSGSASTTKSESMASLRNNWSLRLHASDLWSPRGTAASWDLSTETLIWNHCKTTPECILTKQHILTIDAKESLRLKSTTLTITQSQRTWQPVTTTESLSVGLHRCLCNHPVTKPIPIPIIDPSIASKLHKAKAQNWRKSRATRT